MVPRGGRNLRTENTQNCKDKQKPPLSQAQGTNYAHRDLTYKGSRSINPESQAGICPHDADSMENLYLRHHTVLKITHLCDAYHKN